VAATVHVQFVTLPSETGAVVLLCGEIVELRYLGDEKLMGDEAAGVEALICPTPSDTAVGVGSTATSLSAASRAMTVVVERTVEVTSRFPSLNTGVGLGVDASMPRPCSMY
jgi:hypothetical protein